MSRKTIRTDKKNFDNNIYTFANRYDPTRTLTLRNTFSSKMRKRWRAIRGAIRQAIMDRDVLGLQNNIGVQKVEDLYLPQYREFNSDNDQDKILAFVAWLKEVSQRVVLDIKNNIQTSDNINSNWTDSYVLESYRRGVMRAYNQLKANGYDVPDIEDVGGIAAVMQFMTHRNKVGSMQTRTFAELEGIVDDFVKKSTRVLSQDLAEDKSASDITNDLNGIVKGGGVAMLGRYVTMERRAEMTARTEIVRSFNWGQLQTYKNWGAEEVKILAEVVTAGDQRVCERCFALEGQVFPIDEIWGLLPQHPLCRCIYIPLERN